MSQDIQYLIRHRPRGKYTKHQHNAEFFIIKLLKRRSSNLETISHYINKDKKSTRQFITILRRKGYYITLKGYGGLYEMKKIRCQVCGSQHLTINGVRKHHTRNHVD